MSKRSISFPEDIEEHVGSIKTYFKIKTISGVVAIGIKLLMWVIDSYTEGYTIHVEKRVGDKIYIREFPIKKPTT